MIRTGFSFNTAVGALEDITSRLLEIGWTDAPMCDRGGTHGYVRWTKACEAAGLRPVYGVELAVSPDPSASPPATDHMIFLARDSLRPLNDLVGLATSVGRGEPMITYADAEAAGLIAIAGERAIVEKVDWDVTLFGLSPATPKWQWAEAKAAGARAVAIPRNLYPREADLEFFRITLGRKAGTQTYPQWITSDEELVKHLRWVATEEEIADGVRLRGETLASSLATLKRAVMIKPRREKSLEAMCREGAARLGVDLDDPVYKERVERELDMIERKDFTDYFHLLAEMVNWAKERMVVGPARGSSCGSLVCYLIGITAIDPLKHDLIFERFIDITRKDLPDVDLDFSEAHRDLVFEHIEQLYPGRVARLGNVSTFGIKSALNTAGLNLRIPHSITDAVAETAIKRAMGDSRRDSTVEDTLYQTESGKRMMSEYPEAKIIIRMEGHPHNASRHAAGLVATSEPITDYVAVDSRSGTAMCDKYDAESLNLLKVDALGLTQLTIFERAMELIGVKPVSGWHERLPLDDPKVFEVLNQRKFCGIFQFEGNAMRSLSEQITFESLDDIIATTALVRPGPMASGNTDRWVARRLGKAVEYPHPVLEPYLRDTLGVVIYQETILKIGREVGDLSWEDVTKLRQAMSKSLGLEFFARYGEKWVPGAVEKGIPPDVAKKFFDSMCHMGAWAFNKCLCGTTRVKRSYGAGQFSFTPTIAELYDRQERGKVPPRLVSLNDDRGFPQQALRIHKNGRRDCVKLIFDDGSKVVCTLDHKFMINGEWKACKSSRIGDSFTSLVDWKTPYEKNGRGRGHSRGKHWAPGTDKWDRAGSKNMSFTTGVSYFFKKFKRDMKGKPCQECGETTRRMEAHHGDFVSGTVRPRDLRWLCVSCHKKVHYDHGRKKQWSHGKTVSFKVLTKIEPAGSRMTYDIEMPRTHNFMLANGLVTHNSHSVAYAYVSYWSAWWKAHHPIEYACAVLDREGDPAKQIALLREMRREGIDYIPVDPARSEDRWMPTKGPDGRHQLLGPLSNIIGVGPSNRRLIVAAREGGKPLTPALAEKVRSPRTLIDSLYPIETWIDRTFPNGSLKSRMKIVTKPVPIASIEAGRRDVMLIGTPTKLMPKDENEPVKLAKRGGRRVNPSAALVLFIKDDTGDILAKISADKFARFGKEVSERGKLDKAIYAFKGQIDSRIRMLWIDRVRYLGDLGNYNGADADGEQGRQPAADVSQQPA